MCDIVYMCDSVSIGMQLGHTIGKGGDLLFFIFLKFVY